MRLTSLVTSVFVAVVLTACGGGGGGGGATGTPPTDSFPTDSFAYSGDIRVDSLLTPPNEQWNWNFVAPGRGLQYTFDTSSFLWPKPIAFNAAQRSAARAILLHVRSITGIEFFESTDPQVADFHFAFADIGGFGQLQWSNIVTARPAAHIGLPSMALSPNYPFDEEWTTPLPGSLAYETLLHEIGHALGLKHPSEGAFKLPISDATFTNTVMVAYVGYSGQTLPSTFQPYDLLALKWIYGGDGLGGDRGFNSRLGPSLK